MQPTIQFTGLIAWLFDLSRLKSPTSRLPSLVVKKGVQQDVISPP